MQERPFPTGAAQYVREIRRLVARGASRLAAEELLAPFCCRLIEAVLRRCRRQQAQLIVKQCCQLRCDEIRRLRDDEPDTRIAEAAPAAHLPYTDVAVPVRDGPIGRKRLEPD